MDPVKSPIENPETKRTSLSLLRKTALVTLFAGVVGSLTMMFQTGRNNDSVFLMTLFAAWVFSPFAALAIASRISVRWSNLRRAILYCLVLLITVGSLIGYSGALSPAGTKPAFVFLVIPLISWLLMAIVIPVAALFSRKSGAK